MIFIKNSLKILLLEEYLNPTEQATQIEAEPSEVSYNYEEAPKRFPHLS